MMGGDQSKRWAVSQLRLDILEGDWTQHLIRHMQRTMSIHRIENMGTPSLSINLFKSIVHQIAALYDRPPLLANPDLGEEGALYLQDLGIWAKHQRLQRYIVGLRECFLSLSWAEGDHLSPRGPTVRVVPPTRVRAYSSIEHPSIPHRIEELRERVDPTSGQPSPSWDVWDVSDPTRPYYEIRSFDMRQDLTDLYGARIDPYPYVDPATGAPYLPWVLYHASEGDCLFSSYDYFELVEGSLDVARDWSSWAHALRDGVHKQKYTQDARLKGATTVPSEGADNRMIVEAGFDTLMQFASEGDGQGEIGVLDSSIDPDKIASAIQKHAQAITMALGFGVADVQTASAQSGIAITLRRETVRALQRSYLPQAMKGDLEYVRKLALIHNLHSSMGDIPLPTEGWTITYPGLPMSHEEQTQRWALYRELLEGGLMSRAEVLARLEPGLSISEAQARIDRADALEGRGAQATA